jgi:hypothetical protein
MFFGVFEVPGDGGQRKSDTVGGANKDGTGTSSVKGDGDGNKTTRTVR